MEKTYQGPAMSVKAKMRAFGGRGDSGGRRRHHAEGVFLDSSGNP
jgi:hypothetical protein